MEIEPRKGAVSLLLGLSGLAGAFFTPHYSSQNFQVFILWSFALPLLAGMAYGGRYGLLAGTLGLGSVFPLFIWPTNGWASVVTMLFYIVFYPWQGYFARRRQISPAWWNYSLVAYLPFALVYIAGNLILYPWAFSYNPPFWAPFAETSMSSALLKSIITKAVLLHVALLIIVDCLLKQTLLRRLLGLPISSDSRHNFKILLASLTLFMLIWYVYIVFNRIFIDHTFPHNLLQFNSPYEEIALVIFIFISLLAALTLIHYTEKRNASQAVLQQSEQRYRSLFANARDGIIIADAKELRIADANPAACTLLDCSFPQLQGRALKDFFFSLPPSLSAAAALMPQLKETAVTTASGSLIPIAISISHPFQVAEKTLIVSVFRDITERRQAAADLQSASSQLEYKVDERTRELSDLNSELNAANQELAATLQLLQKTQLHLIKSEKLAGLGTLVAGISHEINTPVGIAVTAASHLEEINRNFSQQPASTLKRQQLLDYLEQHQEASEIILNNLQRASDLIRSFKQISIDQSSENQREFNVKQYLGELLLSLHPLLRKYPHTVTVNCPDDIIIHTFPGILAQIITNLFMNSLLHAYAPTSTGTLTIDVQAADKHITFCIADDGSGMPAEVRARIFEPFFTTNRQQGSTGLGLHIVYNLVTLQLGGTIECHSAPGQGTAFIITWEIS